MKVEFNQKKATNGLVLGTSAGVGALVSKGAMSIAPASLKKPISKAVVAVITLVAASTIQGNGMLETASKGALLGAGVQQAAEAAIAFIKPTVTIGENPTMGKKFIAGALAGADDANETFELPQASLQRRSAQPVQARINVI